MRTLVPYWRSASLASDLFDEMDPIFSALARTTVGTKAYDERSFSPACEILESEEHFMLSLDIPGMKREDIKLEVNDNILTVSGERKRQAAGTTDKVQRFERSYGFFKRSFTLPQGVESGAVEARYEDGVLEVCLPKTQAAKPRQIEVQSGKSGIFGRLVSKSDKAG